MTRVWQWNRPVTVREVLEDLQQERSIAYTTVMTVMDNLHQKGWVRREAEGRAYRYDGGLHPRRLLGRTDERSLVASDNPAAALVAFFGMMSRGTARGSARCRTHRPSREPPEAARPMAPGSRGSEPRSAADGTDRAIPERVPGRNDRPQLSDSQKAITVRRARTSDVPAVRRLLDAYVSRTASCSTKRPSRFTRTSRSSGSPNATRTPRSSAAAHCT